jgi:hypothetical protein
MRTFVRLVLAGSALLGLAAAAISLWRLGPADPSAWATVAAGLAVVAAVASGWTSQRVLELQEDAQAPNPVPIIDVRSRYQLAQFRITNHGGASAHNVRIVWHVQLRDANGTDVLLGRDVAIPVIPERESASVLLGSSNAFIGAHADTTCRGIVSYENASGRTFSKPFLVSAEHERAALVHNDEMPKTLWELQQIPDELKHVAAQIKNVVRVLGVERSNTPSNTGLQPTAADDEH